MSQVNLTLSDDQRDLQELARDFAAREIRPIAAEIDEADDGRVPVGSVGEGDRGRPDLLHAAGGVRRRRRPRLPDRVRDPGGAELRRRRTRIAGHLGRVLRRTRARARQRRAAAALPDAALRGSAPAAHRARDDRAGLRLGRRGHDDARTPGRPAGTCSRVRRPGSRTAASQTSTWCSRRPSRGRAARA